jgi:hypothetical protein
MSLTKQFIEMQESAPAQTLQRVCASLLTVARNVQFTEGRLLDFETADEMQRALHASLSLLEELTVAVTERSAR